MRKWKSWNYIAHFDAKKNCFSRFKGFFLLYNQFCSIIPFQYINKFVLRNNDNIEIIIINKIFQSLFSFIIFNIFISIIIYCKRILNFIF